MDRERLDVALEIGEVLAVVLGAGLLEPLLRLRCELRQPPQRVERQLEAAGAARGDEVVIGDRAFEFYPGEPGEKP